MVVTDEDAQNGEWWLVAEEENNNINMKFIIKMHTPFEIPVIPPDLAETCRFVRGGHSICSFPPTPSS